MEIEKRTISATYQNDGNKLVGFSAMFNTPTEIHERGRKFIETIAPGAFLRSLMNSKDVLCCFNHDPNRLLGRTSSRTMTIKETEQGLYFEVDLPDTPTGNEVKVLTQRGDLRGASFTFSVKKDTWDGNKRTLNEVDVIECGPVVMPAYEATSVALRSSVWELALLTREKLLGIAK
jgi:HK97 family phage prohead protease